MIRGVIFDLDGVIVSTDECHFRAWKRAAGEEGIPFSEEQGHRCRGVSRMESLEIVFEGAARRYSAEEREEFARRKNGYYLELIGKINSEAILPGVMPLLNGLREAGLLQAIGSSSKNTPTILRQIGLHTWFDAVADGNDILRSKPDPEVFLLAARRLGLFPGECVVVEDAEAGVEAALTAQMRVLAVGAAAGLPSAPASAVGLEGMTARRFLSLFDDEERME